MMTTRRVERRFCEEMQLSALFAQLWHPKSIFVIAKLFNKSNLSMINCHRKYASIDWQAQWFRLSWFGLGMR